MDMTDSGLNVYERVELGLCRLNAKAGFYIDRNRFNGALVEVRFGRSYLLGLLNGAVRTGEITKGDRVRLSTEVNLRVENMVEEIIVAREQYSPTPLDI